MWSVGDLATRLLAIQDVLIPSWSPIHSSNCVHGSINLSTEWQLLGPFEIGTREATWGSDPLERLGSFTHLEYNGTASFRSSLAPNASVGWSTINAQVIESDSSNSEISINVDFTSIDWPLLQSFYGWAALQHQSWMRGWIDICGNEPQTVVLHTDRVLEYFVDHVRYFGGDFYAYRRAPPVLRLTPGRHQLDVRLVRDVRAMGGVGNPTVNVVLKVEAVPPTLQIASDDIILPDLADGKLAAAYGSLALRNNGLQRVTIAAVSSSTSGLLISLLATPGITLEAGQSRPIAFSIKCVGKCPDAVELAIEVADTETLRIRRLDFKKKSIHEVQKITFLHPGDVVSYAMIRPPSPNATCHKVDNLKVPVLLHLHGAGNEAEDSLVSGSFDVLPDLCAFIVFATGVTTWSGDDWHQWGFNDITSAVSAIAQWPAQMGWKGPRPDVSRWLVSGHSNGGQGVWYLMTHAHDIVRAAVPVSGYSSIQNYVPYHFWHPMDPSVRTIIEGATNNYSHELLLPNAQGIAIAQQHGEIDDNVPAYHSRLLNTLLEEAGVQAHYKELQGVEHWFDGIMTTTWLHSFYHQELGHMLDQTKRPLPNSFSVLTADPGATKSKHGILVIQLIIPGRLGTIQVDIAQEQAGSNISGPCQFKTSNVLVFKLPLAFSTCHVLTIDRQQVDLPPTPSALICNKSKDGSWLIWPHSGEDESTLSDNILHRLNRTYWPFRTPSQSGAMDAILRTNGAFRIIPNDESSRSVALQISRNLYQYFGADSEILPLDTSLQQGRSTVIRVVNGTQLDMHEHPDFPIRVDLDGKLSLRDTAGYIKQFDSRDSLAAIFVRPIGYHGLELVVWGANSEDLQIAARLVPMLSGVGQPDFVIADRTMMWKGASGVLALGFFDHRWNVSQNSYVG